MSNKKTSFWMRPQGFAAMGLIASVTYFLLMEHRQHVFAYLPFLLLIVVCPLMHIFMHRGHGHQEHDEFDAKSKEAADNYQKGLEEGRKQSNKSHSQ